MEDDDETKSHVSNESDDKTVDHQDKQPEISRQSSPPSGIITVTVASAAPSPATATVMSLIPTPSPPSLTLGLPIQNNLTRPVLTPTPIQTVIFSGGGGGRDDVWSDKATSILVDAWGERYMELSRGNLKQKHWQEVADIVNGSGEYGKTLKTDIQCKNRIDTVKKKFKVEKAKVVGGSGPSQWQFYERLDKLIGPSALNSASKGSYGAGVSVSPAQEAAVPVGIPFGGRQQMSLPFVNYNHTSVNLQALPLQQHQPQPIRHNFPSPISQQQQRFNHHNLNMHNNSHSYSTPPSNSSGRQYSMLNQQQLQQLQYQQQQQQLRRGAVGAPAPVPPPVVELESEEEGWSNDSVDSLPPETGFKRKKGGEGVNISGGVKKGKGKGKKAVKVWGNSVRELTRAILKFGEAYETAESAKLEHIVEMEKQRMKFAKELELQRMKFLMKTQLELSQFNGGGGGGSGSGSGSGNSGSRGGASSGRRGGGGSGGGGIESNHVH